MLVSIVSRVIESRAVVLGTDVRGGAMWKNGWVVPGCGLNGCYCGTI